MSNYDDSIKEKDHTADEFQSCCRLGITRRKKEEAIQRCLHARRTRLLAMVFFLFPVERTGAEWAVKKMKLREMPLRSAFFVTR